MNIDAGWIKDNDKGWKCIRCLTLLLNNDEAEHIYDDKCIEWLPLLLLLLNLIGISSSYKGVGILLMKVFVLILSSVCSVPLPSSSMPYVPNSY